mmetsp:Transcript_6960/g.17463  ORF Transcript_6960/g.17463 Transcript_6960/m.17463 type:complete len:80 (+) Transcript_6960:216-455(+)
MKFIECSIFGWLWKSSIVKCCCIANGRYIIEDAYSYLVISIGFTDIVLTKRLAWIVALIMFTKFQEYRLSDGDAILVSA